MTGGRGTIGGGVPTLLSLDRVGSSGSLWEILSVHFCVLADECRKAVM